MVSESRDTSGDVRESEREDSSRARSNTSVGELPERERGRTEGGREGG